MSQLHVRTLGRGPPLLLLHGFGFDHRILLDFACSLAWEWRVTLVDLPGYGNSAACEADLQTQSRLLEPLLQPATIIAGWSLGGLFAIQLAHARPSLVQGVLLLAASPCFVRRAQWPFALRMQEINALEQLLLRDRDAALRRLVQLVTRGSPGLLEWLRARLTGASRRTLLQGLRQLRQTDARAQLSHLRCPVRCVLGRQDALVPAGLASQIPAQVLEGCGHMPFVTHRRPVARVLRGLRGAAHGTT